MQREEKQSNLIRGHVQAFHYTDWEGESSKNAFRLKRAPSFQTILPVFVPQTTSCSFRGTRQVSKSLKASKK